MNRYESKQVVVNRSAHELYLRLSNMDGLTPFVEDKVEGWQATPDSCSFRAKGFPITLHIAERVPSKLVKVVTDPSTPVKASLSIAFDQTGELSTNLKVILEIELNMMLKMMVGDKLQQAVDTVADALSQVFNYGTDS